MKISRPIVFFSDVFDPDDVVEFESVETEPEIIQPSYGQADVESAHEAGLAEGYASGRLAAAAAESARIADAVEKIAQLLDDAGARAARVAEQSAEAIVGLVLGALAVGYPQLCARFGAEEARHFARSLLPTLAREPHIVVRCHPSIAGPLEEDLSGLPVRLRQSVNIETIPSMAIGDIQIAWPEGFAVREAAAAWNAVLTTLEPLGLRPETAVAGPAAKER